MKNVLAVTFIILSNSKLTNPISLNSISNSTNYKLLAKMKINDSSENSSSFSVLKKKKKRKNKVFIIML